MDLKRQQLLKDFIRYCKKELNIQSLPHIKLVSDPAFVLDNRSFGGYFPQQMMIKLFYPNSDESPVEDVFTYIKELEEKKKQSLNKKPTTTEKESQIDKVVYVAGGDDEKDDQSYMESLSTKYPNIVKTISIHEKDGKVTSYYVRELLRKGDYESFKKTLPEAAFNKGYAKPIFQSLVKTIQETPPTEDGSEETATA